MSIKSQSEHILELSRELLDDIELSRIDTERLLLKCSRLARLAGTEEAQEWIKLEMQGYNTSSNLSLRYMSKTGRWTDKEKQLGHWGPLSQHEAAISAYKAKIAACQLPSISGDAILLATARIMNEINSATASINQLSKIRGRVLGLLHTFVTEIYYQREFASLAENIFEGYKKDVDVLIASSAGEVLNKIPSIINRLSENDEEGVSQALVTCRRIIESFADAIYPPTDAVLDLGGGNVLKLDASKHQNRINAFIHERTDSKSRKMKLRQNLSNLFDRVSTGVHKDVTSEEAYSLFLNVYLFLGEVLHIAKQREN